MSKENIIHTELRVHEAARLISPSVERNKAAIGNALVNFLPKGANVFEVASGTGEHAVHFCSLRRDQIYLSQNISTLEPNWTNRLSDYDIVFCANMIHIAPWSATIGLIEGSYSILQRFGMLVLYGPFLNGKNSANSNLRFDEKLKSQNSCWGVREINDICNVSNSYGFKLYKTINMPSNNKILIFKKL